MSHEVETMFYYGATPWHGLGKKVAKALTAEEAIKIAGLDWEVETVPVYHPWQNEMTQIENKIAIRRVTDGRILGVLSINFTPVQNIEAFEFFDEVVADKVAKYHTAGSLLNGARIWMLAKLNGNGKGSTISIQGDAVDKYLLLMNGHDGGLALKMFFTPIRVVCMNTLMVAETQALRGRSETFYARHTEGIKGRMIEARDILGISVKFYDDFTEKARRLARIQLPPAELPRLLVAAFQTTGAIRPEDVVQPEEFSKRREQQFQTVTRLFEGEGKGLDAPKIKGTKWAAYNAIVEYVDYAREHHGGNPNDLRLRSAWLGTGAQIKKRAWDYMLKL